MKTKEITPIQYADYKGCSLQYVTDCLRKNKPLDEIISVTKYSRFFLLEVQYSLKVNTIEQSRANLMAKYPSSFVPSEK